MPQSESKPVVDRAEHISASQFKATCLERMDDIARTGRDVVVTKRGRPVVRVSAATQYAESPWGFLRGTIVRQGDIVSANEAQWATSETDQLRRNSRR